MNTEFIYALKEIEKEKAIPMDILLEAIESALISAYKRNSDHKGENVAVRIDRDTGDTEVYQTLTVVETVEDPETEISLKEAKEYDDEVDIGDEIEAEVTPSDFGRIAAQTAKQVIVQRIRDAERDIIYDDYLDKVGSLITGIFQRYESKSVLLEVGKIECVIPPEEQVETEHFKFGDKVKVYILEVSKASRGAQIITSRLNINLIIKLFELEVPEIPQGVIKIKNAVREPGFRTKISVASKDSNVDPVGACVGPKGSRVKNIVEELRGEKLDIISWNEGPAAYISNALSPAKVVSVIIYEHTQSAYVIVPDDQLSLAIGKEGQNARLAARLTGWKIDIKSETQAKEEPPPPPPTPEEIKAFKAQKEKEEKERREKEEEKLRLEKELSPEKLALMEIAEPGVETEEVKEEIIPQEEIKEEPELQVQAGVVEEVKEDHKDKKHKRRDKIDEVDAEKEKEKELFAAKKKIKKPKRSRYLEYDDDDEYSEYYRKFDD
ncbi:MAG: transcription termination factor NusA [Armatimonadota bacterium]